MTTDATRAALLQLARDAVTAFAHGLPVPDPIAASGRLAGVFVTLHKGRDLRGCIGHVEADRPLERAVASCAVAAASADPRFPPLSASELPAIQIELSILGPLEPVHAFDDIDVGRHGLVVEQGWRRGLLLPQVAVEWKWDRGTFVRETCRKAGLPPDAWPGSATLWRFEAEVFGEDDQRSS